MKIGRWTPKFSIRGVIRVAIGILVVLLLAANERGDITLRFVRQMEYFLYDARLRLFMPRTVDTRVAILDIDEKSLAAEGRWPWSRDKMATMITQLFERYQVKVVGFDVAFAEVDTSSGLAKLEELGKTELRDTPGYQAFLERARKGLDYDRLFAEAISKYPVVLGFFLVGRVDNAGVLPPAVFQADSLSGAEYGQHVARGYSGNIKPLQEVATAAGHLYPALDVDGTTRRVPIFMRYGDGFYEAMSLAVTRTYLENAPVKVTPDKVGNRGYLREVVVGDYKIPLDETMTALVPFRGDGGGFRYISATDVIRGTLPADELKGKIIVVGTSAAGLKDLRATPVQEDLAGVEIHASLISGILDRSIKHNPIEVLGASILMLLLIGIPAAVLMPRMSALVSTALTVLLIGAVVAFNLYQWKVHNFVQPLAPPLMMLVTLYFINMAWGFFAEARSRRLITGLFGTYVPKELVAEMSKNPEEYSMRGETREMTVLFSDVRDFTSISEGLTAEQLKDMMNAYLTAMTQLVQQRRGTIDKYIGDAIMAFWGAPLTDPDHARNALETAMAMQKGIRDLDEDFVKRGWPMLNIGVGLNCGPMNVGDMGSAFRRAYTVLGDAVNLASRLEGLTKEYGLKILVSGNIVQSVPGFIYREIDKVRVKGKNEGVAIYEPIGKQGEVGDTTLKEVDTWEKALSLYRKGRFEEAKDLIKPLAYANPEVKLYKLYLERIIHFRTNPVPANWDGVFTFTTK